MVSSVSCVVGDQALVDIELRMVFGASYIELLGQLVHLKEKEKKKENFPSRMFHTKTGTSLISIGSSWDGT